MRPVAGAAGWLNVKMFEATGVVYPEHAGRAIARVPGGPPAHRLFDHVNDVALLYEEIGPAFAAVRGAHPVGRRLRIAVDQHKRIRSPHILWCHHLDIDLATHDLLAGFSDILAADLKEATRTYR
jgi:hypothetical protein